MSQETSPSKSQGGSLDPTVVKAASLRTLVVDCTPEVRAKIAMGARTRGHHVYEAGDAASALELFDSHQPQLVFLCWDLPDASAPDLVRQLRQRPRGRDPHLILASDNTTPDQLASALRSGVDDCMPKPPPDALLTARLMIAEQRLADRREQRTTRKRLRRAEAMESVATLARGIAHDINNALGPIIGYTQLVQRSFEPGDKNYDRLDSILRSCDRARLLVEQVLLFSRIGTAEVKPVDVLEILSGIGKSLETDWKSSGIQVELDLPDNLPTLPGNPTYLKEAILNIAQNGIEAMPQGGTLTLQADSIYLDSIAASRIARMTAGQHVMVRVADTGAGMPPEVLSRAFDPFYTTKVRQRVTGMGLSVAQGVVQSHEGAIEVDTESGRGTKVTIWLPLQPQRLDESSG